MSEIWVPGCEKRTKKNMFTTITTTIEDISNSKKRGNRHYLLKQGELFWCFCFGGTNYDVPKKMKRVKCLVKFPPPGVIRPKMGQNPVNLETSSKCWKIIVKCSQPIGKQFRQSTHPNCHLPANPEI